MESGMFWNTGDSGETILPLTTDEKALRMRFVHEYLKDHDYLGAAIRVGFMPQYAQEYATKFAEDPFVQLQIDTEMTKELTKEEEAEHQRVMKRRVDALLLKQAGYTGAGASHGARVSALAKLASIYGMDAPTKVEQTVQHRGGVMMVPGIANMDEWEAQAMLSQEKLTGEAES